jgi:superfamily II DNA or RNA helicase
VAVPAAIQDPVAAVRQGPPPVPGSRVVVRDEEWLVESVARASDGWRLTCRGTSDLVRDTTATFFTSLDHVEAIDPAAARLVPDDSPGYRRTRLWLEAMLRKTPVPLHQEGLCVAHRMLLDPLAYQRRAVAQALSLDNLRPRILIADAVGLGKTLEIGMILAELIRRGRGERILVVTPRHVLQQMQRELWTRFAIPLVRLDSDGIQKVRQELPATRNPFTYYPRVIVSVDTLKSDRYRAHLGTQQWDAVVVDESHNVTNTATQNNRLVRLLAPNTEALVLASATPHNGRPESFAALIDLLDPTAIVDPTDYSVREIAHLFVRRHRHSPDVDAEVGHQWAERLEPEYLLVDLTPAEEAVVTELADTWLHPAEGAGTATGRGCSLFPWTLAKAFLSSPHALAETVANRRRATPAPEPAEAAALARLADLTDAAIDAGPAKLDALVAHLGAIGIGRDSPTRVVCFTERLATLRWLREEFPRRLGLPDTAFEILDGRMPDHAQARAVEQFGLADAPVRVLLSTEVASEGVNLHRQCHHLVHVDLPWSLIRIEQRNGRIDRYGQDRPPRITALVAQTTNPRFSADVRILTRLLAKEHAAHKALGDAAGLMRLHDPRAEEEAVARALADGRELDTVVPDPRPVTGADVSDAPDADGWDFDDLFVAVGEQAPPPPPVVDPLGLFPSDLDYLREAVAEVFEDPHHDIGWLDLAEERLVQLSPPPDLRRRLGFLPQEYVAERKVRDRLVLATHPEVGNDSLREAARHGSRTQWPEAHYLSPLHPVLEWVTDRALARFDRGEVPAVVGDVDHPTVLVQGVLHNERGQVLAHAVRAVEAVSPKLLVAHEDGLGVLRDAGIGPGSINTGGVGTDLDAHSWVVAAAVERMRQELAVLAEERIEELTGTVREHARRIRGWRRAATERAEALPGLASRKLRDRVEQHGSRAQELADSLIARRDPLIRPLVAVLPQVPRFTS